MIENGVCAGLSNVVGVWGQVLHFVCVLLSRTQTLTSVFRFGEKLDICSTAVEPFLELDLILYNQGFSLWVYRLREEC